MLVRALVRVRVCVLEKYEHYTRIYASIYCTSKNTRIADARALHGPESIRKPGLDPARGTGRVAHCPLARAGSGFKIKAGAILQYIH